MGIVNDDSPLPDWILPSEPDDFDTEWQPEDETNVALAVEGVWCVIVYNDEWHTYDEVILQLQKATGCSLELATTLTREIDMTGRAVVYKGDRLECRKVAAVLREIRLQVELDEA